MVQHRRWKDYVHYYEGGFEVTHAASVQVLGKHYQTGEGVLLHIENGMISSVEPASNSLTEEIPMVGPGLVDLQINGFKGMDFNAPPFPVSMVHRVTRELLREGVTSYFPTVITNGDQAIESAVGRISDACREDVLTRACIAGIHLEGPFISPEDGPRGAHQKQYVKAPNWDLFQRWQDKAQGLIKIVTLSPEWEGSTAFIEKCAASDVIASIGHTAANTKQIDEAVRAGARMSTHLGNGSHLHIRRHPNYIWDQLAEDALWAGIIADGFHLPDSFLKVALKAKGPRLFLVSDAVSLSGMPSGDYNDQIGGEVTLSPEGRLHLTHVPDMLAGSAQLLTFGIEHLVHSGICDLEQAWSLASTIPSRFMKLPTSEGLKAGSPADLVLFEMSGGKINMLQTYKQGRAYSGI